MLSTQDFDHFLKKGFIQELPARTSMKILLNRFGDDFWIVHETEVNGLIYGIIKVGFIEFHIYNEQINGISYRPDLLFPLEDFEGIEIPWIEKKRKLSEVEMELSKRNIQYRKYTVFGPQQPYETAGMHLIHIEEGQHAFIDTEGGVTFLFEEDAKEEELVAFQICKYYNIQNDIDETGVESKEIYK